tara:strand:+ start:963 stop:1478 length:516 start_codon:yes stop_codon:yes gene_type:complete
MTGALLSEVWPDMIQKPKKAKKQKKKSKKDDLLDTPPLTPQEMETELLEDNENEEQDPRRKLQGMRVSPYTDNEVQYQNTRRRVDLDLNDNIVRPDPTRAIARRKPELVEDPDYEEFLEFKKLKESKRRKVAPKDSMKTNEQFNELLLYVFTGFFLLMIYDNIYKLGKNSY